MSRAQMIKLIYIKFRQICRAIRRVFRQVCRSAKVGFFSENQSIYFL
jgi:hypothetical protein